MKNIQGMHALIATAAFAGAVIGPARATDYTWANNPSPENDLWQTPSNWNPSTGYPGESDKVEMGYGNGPIRLAADVTVKYFK